ncbi:MAG: helix-turn-helix domain-containing protein [Taibaiella sp.]|jgi:transcriptional regulator with XRE-family HTH domain
MKVNEKLSMLLILEKSKMSKDGKAPITVRLTIDCKRAEMSLGHKVSPEMWNQDAGMAIGSSIESRQINGTIDRVKVKLRQQYDFLAAQHEYVSAQMVKAAYQNKKKPDDGKSFLQTIDFMIEKMEKKVEKEKLAKGTLSRWRTTRGKIVDFLNFEYHVKERELNNFTQQFVSDQLEMSVNSYSQLERGMTPINIDRLQRLADLYHMSLTDLIGLADQTFFGTVTNSAVHNVSDAITINNGISEEERKMYKDTIARLEQQNNKLMNLIDKLSEKL